MGVSSGYKVDQFTLSAVIQMYGGSAAPPGWLLCDGSAVSRATYSNLFGIIGTTYGAGDGSTTFNLPDMRGRVPVMKSADAEFTNLGQKGGEKTHTLSITEIPSHNHLEVIHGQGGTTSGYGVANFFGSLGGTADSIDYTEPTGGGSSHNNLQPYFTIQFIIKQ